MRLKTKLVLAITTLVFLVAGVLSLVYVSQLLHGAVQESFDTSRMGAQQIWLALENAIETGLKGRTVNPNDPGELRALVAQTVENSASLAAVIDSVNRYSVTVYDISIGDSQNNVILSSNPDNQGHPLPYRPRYDQLLNANPVQLMRDVFGAPQVYEVVIPLNNNGKLLASVNVGVRTTLLSASYEPLLRKAFLLMGFAFGTALLVAFLLSNLALQPLEDINLQLDYWTAAGPVPPEEEQPAPESDPVARVSSKIEAIGQRMRNVEEVFSALKENLNQILGNLQDGILLFTGSGRAVLASEAAHRFLQRDEDSMLGRQAWEIFDPSTVLGRALLEAFESRTNVVKEEIRTETGKRIQASVDFIHEEDFRRELGALVTLHDLESAEALESELELSRRMAAIGRLTSGVGHEVKNPINAIVVHLELLKSKLAEANAPGLRHLEVINSEIHRLDRVVQTLVDFSRPVELRLREQDLRPILGDVLSLSSDEFATRNVTLVSRMPDEPLVANVDSDLLKQAVLNVIQNGAQAMPEGGSLEVVLEQEHAAGRNGNSANSGGDWALLRIRDQGPGIPDDIREKIFNLYFTTKTGGSGIGLAMTYRILQLHQGSVEVQSKIGEGTEFRLRIPLAAVERGRRRLQPVSAAS
ncbi:MAG: two-component system sensor histidine kinase NtrB [Acidobacteriota bacterium]